MSTNKMHTFVIRNNYSFANYAKYAYGYFLRNDREGVKITIRKNNVFIHISHYYCVICNDLVHLMRNHRLECNKKAKQWLEIYDR